MSANPTRATAGLAAVAALAATVLSGCFSTGSGTPSAASCVTQGAPLALAIGARANSPQPVLSQSILAMLNSAVSANQPLSIIRLDGQPEVLFSQAFKPTGANTQTRKQEYNNYVTEVNGVLYGTVVKAQTAQANVLGALTIAAGEVPVGGDVIVMDDGLQTTDPLNFVDGILGDNPNTVVTSLRDAHELPDLSGRHVEFVGLGWTALPQPHLDPAYQSKLAQIWNGIATAAGASCVYDDPTPNTSAALTGVPPVTVVPPPPPFRVPGSCSVTDLGDSNNVGFVVDSTTFLTPAAARATLGKLAEVMLKTGESVTLTGSTSSEGGDQYNLNLSLRRAEAVKAVLVQLDVPAGRIATYGDGSHLPGRFNDRGPNGQLLIGPAIKDRKVVAKLTGTGCPKS